MNIDDRLRAASRALRDSSVAQVDAASRLREIVRHSGQLVAHGRTTTLPDQPQEPPEPVPPSPLPQAPPRRTPQRLALVVNLLLVLALGIVIGVAATSAQEASRGAPTPTASRLTPTASTIVATQPEIQTKVPDACIETAELADQVIARLNRNVRDNRLAAVLRDYTIASQACRRAASP